MDEQPSDLSCPYMSLSHFITVRLLPSPLSSTARGICYILLHSLLSLLIKKYLLHFSHSFSNPDWDVWPEGEKPQRSLWINIYLIAAKRSPLLLVTAEMGRGKKTTLWGNQTKRAHKSHADQQAAMYQWGGHWGNDIDWENVPSMKKITYNYR